MTSIILKSFKGPRSFPKTPRVVIQVSQISISHGLDFVTSKGTNWIDAVSKVSPTKSHSEFILSGKVISTGSAQPFVTSTHPGRVHPGDQLGTLPLP